MITVTGNAKITMGGQDVTEIVTDKDIVSVEGLGCKIELTGVGSETNVSIEARHFMPKGSGVITLRGGSSTNDL